MILAIISYTLADAVAIPYVGAKCFGLVLHSSRDRAWAKRLAVPAYLASKAALAVLKVLCRSLVALHAQIRDDR